MLGTKTNPAGRKLVQPSSKFAQNFLNQDIWAIATLHESHRNSVYVSFPWGRAFSRYLTFQPKSCPKGWYAMSNTCCQLSKMNSHFSCMLCFPEVLKGLIILAALRSVTWIPNQKDVLWKRSLCCQGRWGEEEHKGILPFFFFFCSWWFTWNRSSDTEASEVEIWI